MLKWEHIGDEYIAFYPTKTKKKNELVKIPLIAINKQYSPQFTDNKLLVFKCFTDQANNRLLKDIVTHLKIKKKVTYHTSRHTFGSFLASENVLATQRIMGHSNIKTTMEYVQTNPQQLTDVMRKRFEKEATLLGWPRNSRQKF